MLFGEHYAKTLFEPFLSSFQPAERVMSFSRVLLGQRQKAPLPRVKSNAFNQPSNWKWIWPENKH